MKSSNRLLMRWPLGRESLAGTRFRQSHIVGAILVLALITGIKIQLLPMFRGDSPDVDLMQAWQLTLLNHGPAHVYREIDGHMAYPYTPALLYLMLFLPYRMIPILADLVLAVLIYDVVGVLPALVFVLNPALIYISLVWGQTDSAVACAIFGSVVLASRRKFVWAWIVAVIGALMKAQGLVLLPLLGWWTVLEADWKEWFTSAAGGILTAVAIYLPFVGNNPWAVVRQTLDSIDFFPWASVNAFNLHVILGGLIVPDSTVLFAGISYFTLGNVMLAALYIVAGWFVLRRRQLLGPVALLYVGMFLFAPRMHERYLYYGVTFLTPLAVASPLLLFLYVMLSGTFLLNLSYVYYPWVPQMHIDLSPGEKLAISWANLTAFFVLLADSWLRVSGELEPKQSSGPFK